MAGRLYTRKDKLEKADWLLKKLANPQTGGVSISIKNLIYDSYIDRLSKAEKEGSKRITVVDTTKEEPWEIKPSIKKEKEGWHEFTI